MHRKILNTVRQVANFFGKPAADSIIFENEGKHCFEIGLLLGRIFKDMRILDVGGGMGVNLICLQKMMGSALELFLVDRFEEYTEDNPMGTCTKGIELMQKANISVTHQDFLKDPSLRYDCGYFDVVSCFDVVEHIPKNPLQLFAEVKRILKPGGVFILGAPNSIALNRRIKLLVGIHPYMPFDEWCSDNYYSHYREYSHKEYKYLLEIAGFKCDEILRLQEPSATRARYRYHKRRYGWISPKSIALWIAFLLETLVPCFRQRVYCIASKVC